MSLALKGGSRTFWVMFRDATGTPQDVLDPRINIFYYDNVTRVPFIVDAAMQRDAVVVVGQYIYPWGVPNTIESGTSVHVVITATDPGSGDTIVREEVVDVVSQSTDFSISLIPPS